MSLELPNNFLKSLPKEIGNLKNLRFLSLGGPNFLTKLPSSIGNLKNLEYLNLEDNHLDSLPSSIGNLETLRTLYLNNNYLKSLPSSIGNLKKLSTLWLNNNPSLRIIPRTLDRSGLEIIKNRSTKFEIVIKPVQRRNVPLNTKRNDPISGYNFRVGNNALNFGYNRYLTEKSLLNWIKTKNKYTNINNINALYSLSPNTNIVPNPFTRQPLFRRNINFVKFVKSNKPNTPNTLAKNLNKTKINNKPKTPNTIKKKAGNAAQNRRTNRN
jgi:Leucine-rich repeat (LRR) protein